MALHVIRSAVLQLMSEHRCGWLIILVLSMPRKVRYQPLHIISCATVVWSLGFVDIVLDIGRMHYLHRSLLLPGILAMQRYFCDSISLWDGSTSLSPVCRLHLRKILVHPRSRSATWHYCIYTPYPNFNPSCKRPELTETVDALISSGLRNWLEEATNLGLSILWADEI
ncbi:uncharacterized protein P174DRAFT_117804 [Aspergillus novofumigatus IBT 16806]|uniref:Uncharacterized protein n=1 Tax=Aspergillus novofumigatus (strain IBT 16806) TaxID=1392255 RepID=A0A2I1CJL9_ASPN1|nr:uncharacterized protein P174DRAFT_117804 [Aspergillus novofumigatus IBT 16806]PKX97822.1 hypothetical protein P174DRAFT_117804 [Aspergillus novofumigatus IBT 16806]